MSASLDAIKLRHLRLSEEESNSLLLYCVWQIYCLWTLKLKILEEGKEGEKREGKLYYIFSRLWDKRSDLHTRVLIVFKWVSHKENSCICKTHIFSGKLINAIIENTERLTRLWNRDISLSTSLRTKKKISDILNTFRDSWKMGDDSMWCGGFKPFLE